MKMARQYTRKQIDAAEKTFKRHKRWFRDDRGALLYGVMAWIYVKEKRVEDARQLLGKAKEKMYNEVLTRNWEALSNNREKRRLSGSESFERDVWRGGFAASDGLERSVRRHDMHLASRDIDPGAVQGQLPILHRLLHKREA